MSEQTVKSQAFQLDWKRFRGEIPLLAHWLRGEGIPWVRFHALPLSKRYADTDAEREIVLHRANRLAMELLEQARDCWMVLCTQAEVDRPAELYGKPILPILCFRTEEDADVYDVWTAYGCLTTWRLGVFDKLLTAIADDEVDFVFWMNRENGAIFAPYDGGFDLFPSTDAQVDELKKSYPDWLSSHSQGL